MPYWGSIFKDAADVRNVQGAQILLGRTTTRIGHSCEKSEAFVCTLNHDGHMVLHCQLGIKKDTKNADSVRFVKFAVAFCRGLKDFVMNTEWKAMDHSDV